MWRLLAVSLLLAQACLRPAPPPPPPPPPPPIDVPPGCLQRFGGEWVHAEDPTYVYAAEDDGGTLLLTARREFGPTDAGFKPRRFGGRDAGADASVPLPPDAGPSPDAGDDAGLPPPFSATVWLQRTPGGFVGETRALIQHPTGRLCEARFPTRVVACADGGLELSTEPSTAVGDNCQAPASPRPQPPQRHTLVRRR